MSLAHQLRLGIAPTGAPDFSQIKDRTRQEWPPVSRQWWEPPEI
jgi:hypothetical protein